MAIIVPLNPDEPEATPPVWYGAGGDIGAANVYAYQDFTTQFGRAPSVSELNLLAPNYVSEDRNIANLTGGRQAISAYYQQRFADIEAKKQAVIDAAKEVPHPTIYQGSPPYLPVSTTSPVPGDGASSLDMPATANAYSPSYIFPSGGVAAPATITANQLAAQASVFKNPAVLKDKNFLIYATLALGGFFILWKWI